MIEPDENSYNSPRVIHLVYSYETCTGGGLPHCFCHEDTIGRPMCCRCGKIKEIRNGL